MVFTNCFLDTLVLLMLLFLTSLYFSGTKNSLDCTLILTEGDSAKTLAVAGLGVVGRDKYGVYPLRGKLLNVREATHKQVRLIRISVFCCLKKYLFETCLNRWKYSKRNLI